MRSVRRTQKWDGPLIVAQRQFPRMHAPQAHRMTEFDPQIPLRGMASAASSTSSRRFPIGSSSTLYTISATLMAVSHTSSFFRCSVTQAWTRSEATGSMSSETTFVSAMITSCYRLLGSGVGSRGGISNSTPPNRANRWRIASARSLGCSLLGRCSAPFRKSRASCSIDLLCSAARILSLRLISSGNWRMVMLAMQSMIARGICHGSTWVYMESFGFRSLKSCENP